MIEQRAGEFPQPDRLVCSVHATDFAPGDLVVVGVDVAVWWVMCKSEP